MGQVGIGVAPAGGPGQHADFDSVGVGFVDKRGRRIAGGFAYRAIGLQVERAEADVGDGVPLDCGRVPRAEARGYQA